MTALILVDIQKDFVPGGALPVPEGDAIVPLVHRLQAHFDLIVATQDWHPPDHGSFAVNHPGRKPGEIADLHGLQQILWPVHCVQNTAGASFVAGLDVGQVDKIFVKGTDPQIDSYSGFFDNGHRKETGLGDYLKEKGVSDVYVVGLATDYCVKYTALDALKLGFKTFLIEDACRGVNLKPGDVARAVDEMKRAGVSLVRSNGWLSSSAVLHHEVPLRQILFEGKHLRLIGSGRWEYAERAKASGAVMILAVTPDDKVILIEQFRLPLGKPVIELPAGLAGDILGRETEEMTSAARRELLEETGYEAGELVHLVTGPPSAGLSSEMVSLFRALDVRRVAAGGGDEHEDITVHEISLSKVDAWLAQKTKEGALIDPKVYAGLYFARRLGEKHLPSA